MRNRKPIAIALGLAVVLNGAVCLYLGDRPVSVLLLAAMLLFLVDRFVYRPKQ